MPTVVNQEFMGGSLTNPAEDQRKRRAENIDAAQSGLPPDWLDSAIAGAGAGWIFGPVGGALGALVAGVTARNRRQGIIQQAAEDFDTGESILGGLDAQLNILQKNAKTDQDKAEIALRRSQVDILGPLLTHYDPSVRARGMEASLRLFPDLSGELDEIEEAQIKREAVEREQQQQLFTNFEAIADDFRPDSRQFEKKRDAYQRLQAALRPGSPAGDLAAVFSFMKMLEPDSAVLPGEAANVKNAGGVDERTRALYNNLLRGGIFTDTLRADFMNRANDFYKIELENYQDQETRFADQARQIGATDEMIGTQRIQYPIPARQVVSTPEEVENNLRNPEGVTRKVIQPSLFARGIKAISTEAVEFVEDLGRLGRGEVVVQEGNRFFIEDAEGNFVKDIDPPQDAIPDLPTPERPQFTPTRPGASRARGLIRRETN